MLPTASNWKLTFDPDGTPLVILAFGQVIESGEFSIPWRQEAQAATRIRATMGARWARGNVTSGIRFTTQESHADDAAARLYCLQKNIALNAYAKVTAKLKLEIDGSATVFELQAATIDEAECRRDLRGTARTLTSWTIGGTGWVQLP